MSDDRHPGRWRESSSSSDCAAAPSSSSSSSSGGVQEGQVEASAPAPSATPAVRPAAAPQLEVNTCLATLDHEPSAFELAAGKLSEHWQSYYGAVVWCRTHTCFPW